MKTSAMIHSVYPVGQLCEISFDIIELQDIDILKHTFALSALFQVANLHAVEHSDNRFILTPCCANLDPHPGPFRRPRSKKSYDFVTQSDFAVNDLFKIFPFGDAGL